MMGQSSERLFGSVKVLSETELEKIHAGALQVLSSTGVRFEDEAARTLLQQAGALVAGQIVRFPPQLIDEALEHCAEAVILGAKTEDCGVSLGRARFITTNGFGTSGIYDPLDGTTRPPTLVDLARLTRLADGLDEVGYCQHQTTPQDIPQDLLDVAQAFVVLANTKKHAHLSTYSAGFMDEVIELGSIAGDGLPGGAPPTFSLGCCSLSPLHYGMEATTLMRRAATEGIPFLIVVGAVAGVTAPVTLAGALVVQTAELLAGLTLAQTVRQGAPIVFGSFTSPMNARDGRQRLGAAELPLMNGATAQMCARYGVPFGYGTGGVTDSSVVGVQTGIEKAMTTLAAALAGVEVIHDGVSGILDSGRLVCYEQMVLENELCQMIRRYLRGIVVDDDSMALSTIEELGAGGNYLTSLHTAKSFRQAIHLPVLFSQGEQSERALIERAREQAEAAIRGNTEQVLTEDQINAMIAIWCRAGLDEQAARATLLSTP